MDELLKFEVSMQPRDRKRGGVWNPDATFIVMAPDESEARIHAWQHADMEGLRGQYRIMSVRLLAKAA